MERKKEIKRKTSETDILLDINLDGRGVSEIDTGIAFLDHMLTLFSKHGLIDLTVKAVGDLEVDCHHTVEDIGIVLGSALNEALGDKEGIYRYGSARIPMDEALVEVDLDFGGRAFLVYDVETFEGSVGGMEVQLFEEFFRSVSTNAKMNLHINKVYGRNAHHIIEGVFKAFGKAVMTASSKNPRIVGVMSTKGTI